MRHFTNRPYDSSSSKLTQKRRDRNEDNVNVATSRGMSNKRKLKGNPIPVPTNDTYKSQEIVKKTKTPISPISSTSRIANMRTSKESVIEKKRPVIRVESQSRLMTKPLNDTKRDNTSIPPRTSSRLQEVKTKKQDEVIEIDSDEEHHHHHHQEHPKKRRLIQRVSEDLEEDFESHVVSTNTAPRRQSLDLPPSLSQSIQKTKSYHQSKLDSSASQLNDFMLPSRMNKNGHLNLSYTKPNLEDIMEKRLDQILKPWTDSLSYNSTSQPLHKSSIDISKPIIPERKVSIQSLKDIIQKDTSPVSIQDVRVTIPDNKQASIQDTQKVSTKEVQQVSIKDSSSTDSLDTKEEEIVKELAAEKSLSPVILPYDPIDDYEINPTGKDEHFLTYPFKAKKSVTVYERDYERLKEETYLNDTLIDVFPKIWADEYPDASIYTFSSFFYTKLAGPYTTIHYDTVKRWTAQEDIFKKKFIIIPIAQNHHWFVILVVNPGYCIQGSKGKEYHPDFMDLDEPVKKTSRRAIMPGTQLNSNKPYIMTLDPLNLNKNTVAKTIIQYLKKEAVTKLDIEESEFTSPEIVMAACPGQKNFTDCGVFCLHYMKSLYQYPDAMMTVLYDNKANGDDAWDKDNTLPGFRSHLKRMLKRKMKEYREYLLSKLDEIA